MRTIVRWSGGQRTETTAAPEKYNSERAEQIFAEAKKDSIGPWSDNLNRIMSDGEIAYTLDVWSTMPGNTAFVDAFHAIRLKRTT